MDNKPEVTQAVMDNKPEVMQAVIVGVKIPFWGLVTLLVKYAFAAIPAMLIVSVVLGIIVFGLLSLNQNIGISLLMRLLAN